MPRTGERGGGEARGIGTGRRGDESSGKGGTGGVTDTEGMRFSAEGRCLDTDREIGPTDGTRDFATGSEDHSSSAGRFLLENSLDGAREIRTGLTCSKY